MIVIEESGQDTFEYEQISGRGGGRDRVQTPNVGPDELEIGLVEIAETRVQRGRDEPVDRDVVGLHAPRQRGRHGGERTSRRLFHTRLGRVHREPVHELPQRVDVLPVVVRVVDERARGVRVERVDVRLVRVRVELVEQQLNRVLGESAARREAFAQRLDQVLLAYRKVLVLRLQSTNPLG